MDTKGFLENISNSRDYLNDVLKSHLFIEAMIIEMIEDTLKG